MTGIEITKQTASASFTGAFFGTAFFLGGLLLLYAGYKVLLSLILTVTASEISAAEISTGTTGSVAFRGTVRAPNKTITAPITGNDVVFYRATAKYENKKKTPKWRSFITRYDSVPFELRDETGSVPVHLSVDRDKILQKGVHNSLENDTDRKVEPEARSERENAFLQGSDNMAENVRSTFFQNTSDVLSKPIRFIENRIEPGDSVFIIGTVKTDPEEKSIIDAVRVANAKYENVIRDFFYMLFYLLLGIACVYSFLIVGLPSLFQLL